MTVKLPPIPANMQQLPIESRGYPVPWFVPWVDGSPDFRLAKQSLIPKAILERRCWICGREFADAIYTFIIGPMGFINCINSEPPSHLDCAEFAVQACPFLVNPIANRRNVGIPEWSEREADQHPYNPGLSVLWTTSYWRALNIPKFGIRFEILREPGQLDFWREGKKATPTETRAALDRALALLLPLADTTQLQTELNQRFALALQRAEKFNPNT